MDINILVNITARAWALPILAGFHQGVPGRQAPLLAATGAGRTAFRQSLDHLIALGLVERNPGHGHPLRPEFRLTPLGQEAALFADRVQSSARSPEAELLRRAWTVPVLGALSAPRPFSEIRRRLNPVTDRALSQSLRMLEDHSWIHREVTPSRPPKALYSAINTGARIGEITRASFRI